jgi:2-desacetyl-2-hydroxyethyl bacteriochlorophyllide A dehydrogenase
MARTVVFTAPRQVDIVDMPDPSVQPGQVLIRTLYSGISHGTEMAVYRGVAPFYDKRYDRATRLFLADGASDWHYPIPYGYENVGEVTQLGDGVTDLQVGDRVFTYSGHQTHVVVDQQQAFRLPEGMPPEHGLFVALAGVAYNGILDARILLGETVVIFGLGVVGQLLVQLSRWSGAAQVIGVDLVEKRLAHARRLGADAALNPSSTSDVALQVRQMTGNRGADVVIDCTGSATALNQAIRTVGFQGTVVVVSFLAGEARGLYLGDDFHHNRIRLVSSQAAGVNPELHPRWTGDRKFKAALSVLPRLDLDGLITQRLPFEQAARGYEMVDRHPEDVIQVILTYP